MAFETCLTQSFQFLFLFLHLNFQIMQVNKISFHIRFELHLRLLILSFFVWIKFQLWSQVECFVLRTYQQSRLLKLMIQKCPYLHIPILPSSYIQYLHNSRLLHMYIWELVFDCFTSFIHTTQPVPFYDISSTHFAISGEKTKLPDIIILHVLDSKTQLKGSNR